MRATFKTLIIGIVILFQLSSCFFDEPISYKENQQTNTGNSRSPCTTGITNGPLMGGAVQGILSLRGEGCNFINSSSSSGIEGITTDGVALYFVSFDNTIRQVCLSTRLESIVAGSSGISGTTDGVGVNARFSGPHVITTDGTNLYVTDFNAHTIRKIVISSGIVTTLAGSSGISGTTDGTGTSATFSQPHGITTDGTNLYVTDLGGGTIRQVVISTGVVTTLASSSNFTSPIGITTDGTNLYVADVSSNLIKKIVISTGVVTTFAGNGSSSVSDGIGINASFDVPIGITTDGTNLFVVETKSNTVRKIVISTGVVTTIASNLGNQDITTDGQRLYVTGNLNSINGID